MKRKDAPEQIAAIARVEAQMESGLKLGGIRATREEMHERRSRSRKMRTVTAREANQSFSKLLADVGAGDEVVITRRGRPVAIIKPYGDSEAETRRKAGEELMAFLEKGLDLGGLRIEREELYGERDDELEARRRKNSGL